VLGHTKKKDNKILVVDDTSSSRKVITNFLKCLGYTDITCVNSGESGISSLEEKPFDILFLDILLQNMNGYEMLKKVKRKPKNIIAMTAFVDEDVRKKSFNCGMNLFLSKPVIFEELERIMEKIN